MGKTRATSAETVPGAAQQTERLLDSFQSRQVRIPDREAVGDYLLRHPDMLDLVGHATTAAIERFASDSQLSLELYCDADIEEEYLTVYVRKERYDPDIMDQIDAVAGVFRDSLAGKSGWFLVTTDFFPPR
jgi:hypothetical protein